MIPYSKPLLGAEESAAVEAVLSRSAGDGAEALALEGEVAGFLGVEPDRVVAVASGTAALHLALVAAGIGVGDEVVVPSLDGVVAANTVRYVGAQVVFADVEPTRALSARTVAPVVTPRTRAVVVVHHAGTPADVPDLRDLCDPLGIAVIEDAAPALGATVQGAPLGGRRGLVAFSLGSDNVVTSGEGGLLSVPDPDVADRVRRLRSHGASNIDVTLPGAGITRPTHRELGWNARMSEVHAAIARVQLRRLPLLLHRRRYLATHYQRLLQPAGLTTITDPPHGTSTYQSFWVSLPDDAPRGRELVRILLANGITARRAVVAAHLEPVYAGRPHVPLPTTERVAGSTIALPLFHDLEETDVERIADVVLDALRQPAEAR